MAPKQQTPFDFFIEKAQIFSEKFINEPRLDIKNLITDIEIFEHLDKPYLTGSVAFLDQSDIYNIIDFSGGEKFALEIRLPGTDSKSVSKTFVIEKVLKNIKTADNGAVIVLHLIELHAFESTLLNVNKAYTGKPLDIAQNIIKDNLHREFTKIEKDNQSPMRVIVPNMRPIEASMWMIRRATTANGLPYFFFSTFANDNLHIMSLEDMLSVQYDTGKYRYSQAVTAWSASKTIEEQSYIIQWYSARNSDEISSLVKKGIVGARYYFYDTMLGRPNSSIDFDIVKQIDLLLGQSAINQDQNKISYKDGYELNNTPLNKLQSRIITNLVSTNVYDDLYTYSEEQDNTKHKLKITSKALRAFLVRNVMDIALPGKNFLNGSYSSTVGNQITLSFLKNDTETMSYSNYEDTKKSGTYLIYQLKHSFKRERYDVIASVVKLGEKNE
tara:strand:- start:25055 stop:26380 length:1326 start_codon:yes stop_codon:yes gene_type:complete